ncbi:unnamed protein product, partial [Trichogramma brassicae]
HGGHNHVRQPSCAARNSVKKELGLCAPVLAQQPSCYKPLCLPTCRSSFESHVQRHAAAAAAPAEESAPQRIKIGVPRINAGFGVRRLENSVSRV